MNYNMDDPEFLNQVRDLLHRKGKIEAIKFYREATNVGLKEAKDFVDAIEKQLKTDFQAVDPNLDLETITDPHERIKHAVRTDRKIEAIKLYLQMHQCGLKAAKDAVDKIERELKGEGLTGYHLQQIGDLIRKNKKIEAVKIYRVASGCGLKEALDAVNQIEKQNYGK